MAGFGERFGALVRERRGVEGLTIEDLAQLSGLGTTTIDELENGRRMTPQIRTIDALVVALNLSQDDVERCRHVAPQSAPLSTPRPQGDPTSWPVVETPGLTPERRVFGRDADVEELRSKLARDGRVALVSDKPVSGTPLSGTSVSGTLVSGLGGIGKSTLVRHYIETYNGQYFGIWWLRAELEEMLIDDLGDLAGHLGILREMHATPKARARAVLMELKRSTDPWLVVFDNCTDQAAVKHWLPKNVHCLVTSRNERWNGFSLHRTPVLDPEPATALLLAEAQRDGSDPQIRDAAERLAEKLDYMPLPLVVAGAWLRDSPSLSFDDYRDLLERFIHSEPDTLGIADYTFTIKASLALSITRLSGEAQVLLRVISCLPPDNLDLSILTALADINAEDPLYSDAMAQPAWAFLTRADSIERAFAELVAASVIVETEEADARAAYRVHRLTQTVVRALAEEGRLELTQAYGAPADLAAAMIAASLENPDHSLHSDPARLENNIASIDRDHPRSKPFGFALNQACLLLDAARRDEVALRYAEKATGILKDLHGANSPILGTSQNNLAGFYWRHGRFDDAIACAQNAVDLIDEIDVAPTSALSWMSTLAFVLTESSKRRQGPSDQENLVRAAKIHRRVYRKAFMLEMTTHAATTLNNIASILASTEKWAAALRWHEKALDLQLASKHCTQLEIGHTQGNIAGIFLRSGQPASLFRNQNILDLLFATFTSSEAAFENPMHPERVDDARRLAIAHETLLILDLSPDGDQLPNATVRDDLIMAHRLSQQDISEKASAFADLACPTRRDTERTEDG